MDSTGTHKESRFSDFLKMSQVIYGLQAEDKIQALEELLDGLVGEKLIKNKKPVLTRIIDRERLETTAIGDGVALPHARVNTGDDIVTAVGYSKNGIDFDALDGKKVHIIILIVWNPALPGLFNHLFAGLAQFLRRPDFRDRLHSAKNKTELYSVLAEIQLSLPRPDDQIVSRGSLLWRLQEIHRERKKAKGDSLKQLDEEATYIRGELDEVLLDRFDRLMERYGFAVAEVEDGACMGCFINLATGMSSAIEGSNDIFVCENCGKFIVDSKKEKE